MSGVQSVSSPSGHGVQSDGSTVWVGVGGADGAVQRPLLAVPILRV